MPLFAAGIEADRRTPPRPALGGIVVRAERGTRLSAGDAQGTNEAIRVGFYEDWMRPQVIDMILAQYPGDRAEQEAFFDAFYDAPFQRSHGIRLVAVDGRTLCGFQSYFYWPYVRSGHTFRSFQSGNSLVSPAYRGRGIFAALLSFLEESDGRPPIDFLMGFPVEMSFGSFLRNRWANPFDLSWFGRLIRPLAVIRARVPAASDWGFESDPEPIEAVYPDSCFALSKAPDVTDWRRGYRPSAGYLYFHHREGTAAVRFQLKPNRRGRVNELVIGDVARSSEDPKLVQRALRSLVRAARGHHFLTLLSIALNERCADSSLLQAVRRCGFIRLRPKIHFIVKPFADAPDLTDPSRWWLLRSDIDTW